MLKFFKRAAILIIFLYLALLAFFFVFQSKFIYHPPEKPLADCDLPSGAEFFHNENLQGVFTPAGGRNLYVFFHGNGSSACMWRFLGVNHVANEGYDTLVIEYPGYSSTGGNANKSEILDMVAELSDWIDDQDYDKLVIAGRSLGSGISTKLVQMQNPDAVMLFSPYDEMAKVIRDHAPFIPKFLVRENYNAIKWLEGYEGPVTVIHGEIDEVIPVERSKAFETLTGTDRRVLKNKGHGGYFETPWLNALLAEKLP